MKKSRQRESKLHHVTGQIALSRGKYFLLRSERSQMWRPPLCRLQARVPSENGKKHIASNTSSSSSSNKKTTHQRNCQGLANGSPLRLRMHDDHSAARAVWLSCYCPPKQHTNVLICSLGLKNWFPRLPFSTYHDPLVFVGLAKNTIRKKRSGEDAAVAYSNLCFTIQQIALAH